MKKNFFLLFSLFFTFAYFSSHIVYAHDLQTDNNISAEFHVEPDDNPIPGEQATLHFAIDDRTHKFTIEACTCILSISKQGKIVYSQPLLKNKQDKPSIYNAATEYVFPNNDLYHITLVGKPTVADAFQPFTLSWDFRVNQNNDANQFSEERPPDPTFIYFASIWLGIPILLGISIFLLIRFSK